MVSPTIKRKTRPTSLVTSEGLLIDFYSEERVLVDLDAQDDNNVPQQGRFVCDNTTHVDLDAAVTKSPTITKVALLLDDLPIIKSEGRRSLDSLTKPITAVDVITPDPIPRRNRLV